VGRVSVKHRNFVVTKSPTNYARFFFVAFFFVAFFFFAAILFLSFSFVETQDPDEIIFKRAGSSKNIFYFFQNDRP
jgi:hypothetical protein